MKLARLLFMPAFMSALALVACAHDRPSEARPAEPDPTSYAAAASADLNRIPERPSNADVRAELEAAQRKAEASSATTEAAETDARGEPTGSDASAASADAAAGDGDGDAERREFEVRMRDRLGRVDARAREVKDKAVKLTGTRKTELESAYRRFVSDRNEAQEKIGALGRSTGPAWKSARTGVERSVDDLEATVTKLADKI